MTALPWWDIAQKEMGVTEVAGTGDAARVLEYLRSTSLGAEEASQDETPWCSAFVNWCVEKAGVKGTGTAWARDWMEWGRPVSLDEAPVGAIAILRRDGGGHVGFINQPWQEVAPIRLALLGGNQGNALKVSSYPASRLLGIRVP